MRDVGGVLGGDDHVHDLGRHAIDVAHGDLRFRVGAKPLHLAALSHGGELPPQAVGEDHRGRHELLGLVGGKTEHETLVAGPLLGVLFAVGLLGVHALRDVGGLRREVVVDENGVGVEDVVVVHVADVADGVADDLVDVERLVDGLGLAGLFVLQLRQGDLAADDDDVGLYEGLTGHAGRFVEGKTGIENAVGNEVGDLVRVAFADGFGRKNKGICHGWKGEPDS